MISMATSPTYPILHRIKGYTGNAEKVMSVKAAASRPSFKCGASRLIAQYLQSARSRLQNIQLHRSDTAFNDADRLSGPLRQIDDTISSERATVIDPYDY